MMFMSIDAVVSLAGCQQFQHGEMWRDREESSHRECVLFPSETVTNHGEREINLFERQLLFKQNLDINSTGK